MVMGTVGPEPSYIPPVRLATELKVKETSAWQPLS